MTFEEVERIALEAAAEDYTGLYELVWRLNTLYPDIGEPEKTEAARAAVERLVERGQISLFRGEWPMGEFQSIPVHEVQAVLDSPSSWATERNLVFIAATEAGERAF